MAHLLIHSYQNVLRIISIDKINKYFEDFNKVYNTTEKYFNKILINKGLWLNRLYTDLEYKKFKTFSISKKEKGLWVVNFKMEQNFFNQTQKPDYNETYQKFIDQLILFIETKINLYTTEADEEQEPNELNEPKITNANLADYIYDSESSKFYGKQTKKIELLLKKKILDLTPDDYELVQNKDDSKIYYLPKIFQIDSTTYYLSDDELYMLIIQYINNSFIDIITFDPQKYNGNLTISGDFNNGLLINKNHITYQEVEYICNYLNITNIYFGFLRLSLIPNTQNNKFGYIDLATGIFYENNPCDSDISTGLYRDAYLIDEKFQISQKDDNTQLISDKFIFSNHNSNLITNEKEKSEKDDTKPLSNKFVYRNIITNEIKYYTFMIVYCNEFKIITEINNIKSTIGQKLFDSLINNEDINKDEIDGIIADIDKYKETINLIFRNQNIDKICNVNDTQTPLQLKYTKEYVKHFKDENSETIASQVTDKIITFLSYFLKNGEINNNNIGKNLVDLGVKKTRKAAGYFYNIKNPTNQELINIFNNIQSEKKAQNPIFKNDSNFTKIKKIYE